MPILKETLVIGHGPGAFALDYPQNSKWVYVDRPHNMYLQTAHHSGVIAMGVFVATLAWFFWRSWIANPDPRLIAVVAGVAGYAVAGLVTDSFVGVAPIFWVVWGAGFALLGDKWTRPAT